MAQKWILRLRDADATRLQWMPQQGADEPIGDGDFDAAAAALAGQSVVLLVPGSAVTLHQASLPATSRGKLRAAAPYALEDALADDVEDLHFAVGERDAEGRVALAVVARDWLRDLLDRCSAAGIQVTRVLPESLLLPEPQSGYTVLLEDGWAVVRGGAGEGFAVEADSLGDLLLVEEGEPPPELDVYHPGEPVPTLAGIREAHRCERPLELLRGGLTAARLDLMQGEFSPGEALGRSLRRWRVTAALLVALVGVWAGSSWLEIQRLEASAQALNAEIEQVLRQTFPEIRRVVNPRAQMRQRLAELQGSETQEAGFLDLLAEVGTALAGARELTLTGVNYRRGRLDLELQADQIASLYRLQQTLAASAALEVSVQSANSEQGRAQGRLRVEAKAG